MSTPRIVVTEPEPPCNFDPETWEDGTGWGVEGPVIVCNTHGWPAGGEVYLTDYVPGTGLCQPQHEWLRQHPPNADGECRCGRVPCGFAIENVTLFPAAAEGSTRH